MPQRQIITDKYGVKTFTKAFFPVSVSITVRVPNSLISTLNINEAQKHVSKVLGDIMEEFQGVIDDRNSEYNQLSNGDEKE